MQRGICKLCLLEKPLCDSHFMPRALYAICREEDRDPVLLTQTVMTQSSRQTRDYVLCMKCERLMNREGEEWILPLVAQRDGSFPFYDLIIQPYGEFQGPLSAVYATSENKKINKEKLCHFAIGMFWKASVHPWCAGASSPRIELGPRSETLRRFLRGEGDLPDDIDLLVFVEPPPIRFVGMIDPAKGLQSDFMNFNFYVPGIQFHLCVGHGVRKTLREISFISNVAAPIVAMDVNSALIEASREVVSRVRISYKLNG
jgi:hypothetical protein